MKNKNSVWPNAALRNGYAGGYNDNLPHTEYVRWQRDCLAAMMRLLTDDGAIF
jgi:site-specific DNA-methyltransferase (adenine-specific)